MFLFHLSQSCYIIVQVVVTEGVRPSVEHFEKYSEMVPHSVSSVGQEGDNYVVRVDGMCQLDNTGFFVGVLPHPDTLEVPNIYLT